MLDASSQRALHEVDRISNVILLALISCIWQRMSCPLISLHRREVAFIPNLVRYRCTTSWRENTCSDLHSGSGSGDLTLCLGQIASVDGFCDADPSNGSVSVSVSDCIGKT
jgi:hypothetical protein